jgi:hypothetical protein
MKIFVTLTFGLLLEVRVVTLVARDLDIIAYLDHQFIDVNLATNTSIKDTIWKQIPQSMYKNQATLLHPYTYPYIIHHEGNKYLIQWCQF